MNKDDEELVLGWFINISREITDREWRLALLAIIIRNPNIREWIGESCVFNREAFYSGAVLLVMLDNNDTGRRPFMNTIEFIRKHNTPAISVSNQIAFMDKAKFDEATAPLRLDTPQRRER